MTTATPTNWRGLGNHIQPAKSTTESTQLFGAIHTFINAMDAMDAGGVHFGSGGNAIDVLTTTDNDLHPAVRGWHDRQMQTSPRQLGAKFTQSRTGLAGCLNGKIRKHWKKEAMHDAD